MGRRFLAVHAAGRGWAGARLPTGWADWKIPERAEPCFTDPLPRTSSPISTQTLAPPRPRLLPRSSSDNSGEIQGGSHAEEIEDAEVATDSRSSHAHPAVKIQDESHTKVMENPEVAVAKSRSSSPATAGQVKGSGSNIRGEAVEGVIQMTGDGVATASERSPDDLKGNRVREPFDPERANRNALLLSVLLVVATPAVAWRSLGQPLLLVWRLSLLACFCFSIWTRLLDVDMRARTVFFCSSFGFVLALYADAAKDPRIGMLIACLNSHIAVGMLGYALAERRQRDGTEVSAAAVPILSDEEQAERLLHLQVLGGAYHGLLTLGVAAYVAWVLCHMADYPTEQLVMQSSSACSCSGFASWPRCCWCTHGGDRAHITDHVPVFHRFALRIGLCDVWGHLGDDNHLACYSRPLWVLWLLPVR